MSGEEEEASGPGEKPDGGGSGDRTGCRGAGPPREPAPLEEPLPSEAGLGSADLGIPVDVASIGPGGGLTVPARAICGGPSGAPRPARPTGGGICPIWPSGLFVSPAAGGGRGDLAGCSAPSGDTGGGSGAFPMPPRGASGAEAPKLGGGSGRRPAIYRGCGNKHSLAADLAAP